MKNNLKLICVLTLQVIILYCAFHVGVGKGCQDIVTRASEARTFLLSNKLAMKKNQVSPLVYSSRALQAYNYIIGVGDLRITGVQDDNN